MYKTVPVWKREPVRVLSLFGDIKAGECGGTRRTGLGRPARSGSCGGPGVHAGSEGSRTTRAEVGAEGQRWAGGAHQWAPGKEHRERDVGGRRCR